MSLLGPVNTNPIDSVAPEKAPLIVARRSFGVTKLLSSRLDWCFFRHNPKGWGYFSTQLRYHSLM